MIKTSIEICATFFITYIIIKNVFENVHATCNRGSKNVELNRLIERGPGSYKVHWNLASV